MLSSESKECFDRDFAAKLWNSVRRSQDQSLASEERAFSVVLGLHPDEATDSIVEECVLRKQPFAVVPCCVFASKNRERRVRVGGRERPVRTREELCLFLSQMDTRNIKVERVDSIPGPCNDVVFATRFD